MSPQREFVPPDRRNRRFAHPAHLDVIVVTVTTDNCRRVDSQMRACLFEHRRHRRRRFVHQRVHLFDYRRFSAAVAEHFIGHGNNYDGQLSTRPRPASSEINRRAIYLTK
ncbi:Hypothetical protein NTJ_04483 [Nesidiocoris tenuis]|uniref:Uncharacterized protein n=1 Tax=Nesidiocoris tenuis TaxID=355587 RepID=A0ABN7AHG1_9HEMI|nr:Hypothetical protein NTJ_04483 [Nesidiocoris tenuis]